MRTFCGALLLSLMACATESSPPTITPTPNPDDTVNPVVYSVPGGSSAASLVFGEGTSFQFTGPTAPGSATFTAAPYSNLEEDTPSFGGGSVNITLGGQLYSASNLHSLATTITDDAGEYLAISGYAESPGAGGSIHVDAVLVIIPQSDFAAGATIALDGQDRIALFAAGNPEAETADVYGAAVTGTVQLGAGSASLGGTITATVDGEFGPIEMLDPDPPVQGGDLIAGTYAFTLSDPLPFDVYCEDALAGQEAEFANLAAASLGYVDGSVVVGTGPSLSISGSPISSAFGASSLALDELDAGVFGSFVSQSGTGPVGTTLAGKYIVLDGTSASATLVNGWLGASYETAGGFCEVGFAVTLTAP